MTATAQITNTAAAATAIYSFLSPRGAACANQFLIKRLGINFDTYFQALDLLTSQGQIVRMSGSGSSIARAPRTACLKAVA